MSVTGSPASAPFQGGEIDKPPQTAAHLDLLDHPDFRSALNQARGGISWFAATAVPCCTGPVAYRDRRAARHRSEEPRRRLRRGATRPKPL